MDLASYTCSDCGYKVEGERVSDPGVPLLIAGHRETHLAYKAEAQAAEHRVRAAGFAKMAQEARVKVGIVEVADV